MEEKPLIGVTATQEKGDAPSNYQIGRHYINGVARAGGIPIILPLIQNEEQIQELAFRLDGLLMSGGVDMDPMLFGEEPHPKMGRIDPERDFFEKTMLEKMLQQEKAVFGICRGCQIINLVMGGTIYQDLPAQKGGELVKHSQNAPRWYPTHSVKVKSGSDLIDVFADETIRVNSYHHQAIKDVAPGFTATAHAPDGVVEAIEYQKDQFILGVQWHPEQLWERDEATLELFRMFVNKARG